MHVGGIGPDDRGRVAEILRSTALFRDEEVDVALEVFDEGVGAPPKSKVTDPRDDDEHRIIASAIAATQPDYLLLGVYGDDDRLLGFAAYGPTPATDRTFDLYWIAVDRAAQGTGAGTMLLDTVEERLREHGARMLVIETSARNDYEATRGFYHRRGYEEAARVGAFYAPDDDRVILTKRFPRDPETGRGVMAR